MTGDRGQEKWFRGQVTGDKEQVTGDRGQEAGFRGQVTGDRGHVTGDYVDSEDRILETKER